MLTREELTVLAKLGADQTDAVAKAELQLLFARRVASGDVDFEEIEELLGAVTELARMLVANPSVDVPATLSNLIKGVTAQVRVAIAVATNVEEV